MMKYAAPLILAFLALACAVLEGLFEWLPPEFIQFNGLLIIVGTGAFVAQVLRARGNNLEED